MRPEHITAFVEQVDLDLEQREAAAQRERERAATLSMCERGLAEVLDGFAAFAAVASAPEWATDPSAASDGHSDIMSEPVDPFRVVLRPAQSRVLGPGRVVAVVAVGRPDTHQSAGPATYGNLVQYDPNGPTDFSVRYDFEADNGALAPYDLTEEFSRQRVFGGVDAVHPTDEQVALAKAQIEAMHPQARDTLSLLGISARNPVLNPDLAARFAALAPMESVLTNLR